MVAYSPIALGEPLEEVYVTIKRGFYSPEVNLRNSIFSCHGNIRETEVIPLTVKYCIYHYTDNVTPTLI